MHKNSSLYKDKRLTYLLKGVYSADVALEPGHHSKWKLLDFILKNFVNYSYDTNPTFRKMFQDLYYTGSYFEGLRVHETTEFDIDVVFSIPENVKYKVEELNAPYSFATLSFLDRYEILNENIDLSYFIDEEKHLIPRNVLSWFQSLVDTFVCHFDSSYQGLSLVKKTNSGPAYTLKLYWNSVWISIDLVPVISFDAKLLQKCSFQHVAGFSENSLEFCFLVPKPLKSSMSSSLSTKHSLQAWRVHLPEVEKNIIMKRGCLKQLIKLIKHLRDVENWQISSYFIKVIAFWFVKKHPHPKFWKKETLGSLFLLFLNEIEIHLENQYLGHILYPKFNIFHSLSAQTMSNMQRRIQNIVRKLKENPRHVLRFYNVPILMPKTI